MARTIHQVIVDIDAETAEEALALARGQEADATVLGDPRLLVVRPTMGDQQVVGVLRGSVALGATLIRGTVRGVVRDGFVWVEKNGHRVGIPPDKLKYVEDVATAPPPPKPAPVPPPAPPAPRPATTTTIASPAEEAGEDDERPARVKVGARRRRPAEETAP